MDTGGTPYGTTTNHTIDRTKHHMQHDYHLGRDYGTAYATDCQVVNVTTMEEYYKTRNYHEHER